MLKKVFAMLTTAVIFTATASFAYAADFTPSVERKSEPAVIQTKMVQLLMLLSEIRMEMKLHQYPAEA